LTELEDQVLRLAVLLRELTARVECLESLAVGLSVRKMPVTVHQKNMPVETYEEYLERNANAKKKGLDLDEGKYDD
jgi:hypothetical protein